MGLSSRRKVNQSPSQLRKARSTSKSSPGPRKSAQSCVEKLGAHARELLSLRYEKVWSLQQIAQARGMTLNAVNKALGKIRKALSDCTGGTRMEEMGPA